MKVTLINTSDTGGGAPVACMRLLKALESEQIDAGMLVQHKKTSEPRATSVIKNWFDQQKAKVNLLRERLPFIFFYAKDKSVRFAFSTANTGSSVVDEPLVADADIIHLHWTNFGFLSIDNLKQLADLGKPIVWTLHDMWAFTGGCHYAGTCDHFKNQCGECYFLRTPHPNDLSHRVWEEKLALFADKPNITFVTCSNWLAGEAKKSSLLKGFRIEAIPNPIDTAIYTPQDKLTARKKRGINTGAKLILFGAANIMDRRKGLSYLIEALNILKSEYRSDNVEIVIFGKNKHFDVSRLPFRVHQLGLITSQAELVEIYSMADITVSPSVEDNLPNIIMESLACGTPVAAFDTGGIPDMIDHQQNGYLAQFRSAADLARGIHHILFLANADDMAAAARKKVLDNFSNEKVAARYINVYQSVLQA
ncbi:glycosyltransferase family 4 protein [Mucilaginibacter sp. AW1-3]